jgi:acetyl esterase/lipase
MPVTSSDPAASPLLTADTVADYMRARAAARASATLEEMRAFADSNAGEFPVPEGTHVEPTEAGGVPAEWHVPADVLQAGGGPDEGILLYLHGGAFLFGSPASHRHLTAFLAQQCGLRCMSVDYRLIPEHPFPAALDDAHAAYHWALEQAGDASRIVLAGDSAGGGLAAALMVRLRDEATPLPAAAYLMSPWTDMACDRPTSRTRRDDDPSIDPDSLREAGRVYLGGAPAETPLASPVHADVAGLPPTLIQVGEREVLLDDARDLASAMRRAGVAVRLDVWDRMVHVWQALYPIFPEGERALVQGGAFLRRHLEAARQG